MIDSAFEAKKALAEKKAGKKKRRLFNRVEIVQSNNNVFGTR